MTQTCLQNYSYSTEYLLIADMRRMWIR